VIRFIDTHRERRSAGLRWGIEPICKVLPVHLPRGEAPAAVGPPAA
jgi:hypothetical protein